MHTTHQLRVLQPKRSLSIDELEGSHEYQQNNMTILGIEEESRVSDTQDYFAHNSKSYLMPLKY